MTPPRFSIGPKHRPSRPRMASAAEAPGFDLLCDSDGTVVFGWAARSVLYTRFEGGLSAQTGHAYATQLGTLVAQSQSVSYFCDSSNLKHYDLLARSAFVRVVLSHRRKFASMTMLAWAEGISPALRAPIETLGDPIEVLTDHDMFEARLLKAAPLARHKLDASMSRTAATPMPGLR